MNFKDVEFEVQYKQKTSTIDSNELLVKKNLTTIVVSFRKFI